MHIEIDLDQDHVSPKLETPISWRLLGYNGLGNYMTLAYGWNRTPEEALQEALEWHIKFKEKEKK